MLFRGAVKPGCQQPVVCGGVDAGERVRYFFRGEHAPHVAHGPFQVRETQHLVNVLNDCAQVQQQRLVVFGTRLGETLGRRGERVHHALILGFRHLAQIAFRHDAAIHDGRRVAASVSPERCHDRGGGHFVEVPAEYVAVRLLREGLGRFERIPKRLHRVVVRLGETAFFLQAGDERIPSRRVDATVGGLLGPSAAK